MPLRTPRLRLFCAEGFGLGGEMKRTLAVAVAALGLIAWVDPKTATPNASKDQVAEEAKREAAYMFSARWKEIRRVDEIAFRLQVANQDLCQDRGARLGMAWATAESFESKLRDAAVEALQLKDGLTVTYVVPGSPAAAAGLQPQDVLVSFNGETVPTGKLAAEKLVKRLTEKLGRSTAPVTIVVRRAEETRTFSVTPVMACGYDIAVDDGSEINAYADGKTVHLVRPILRLAESDEELALVIAHELAHNGQHHLQAKLHNARMAGLGGLLLDGVAAANGVNTKGAFTRAGMQIGGGHGSVAFEAEADYVGMYYMARAGYSTQGVENFWRKMAVEAPQSIFIKTDHPATPDRFLAIAAASSEIEAKRAKGEALVPNQKPE
ncbi:MAG: peptidase Ste24p [Phenylobacterium sp.]|nr:peptidase Ste24p [Phenylobacterium sp.]